MKIGLRYYFLDWKARGRIVCVSQVKKHRQVGALEKGDGVASNAACGQSCFGLPINDESRIKKLL